MRWFTRSVGLTASGAYHQAKSKLHLDGTDPDAGQVQDQLDDDFSTNESLSATDREMFDEMSSEEISYLIPELKHRERRNLLKDDEFIQKEWPDVSDVIDNSDSLQSTYGLKDTGDIKPGQSKNICGHHDAPLDTDQYMNETVSNGLSMMRNESGQLKATPAGQAEMGTGVTEGQTATAGRTEIRRRTVKVCAVDPNDCPISLKEFVKEADNRLSNINSRDNKTSIHERAKKYRNESADKEGIDTELTDSTASDPSDSMPETAADQNTDTPLHADHTGGDIADDINDSDDVEKTDTTTNNTSTTDDNRSTSKADQTDRTDETDAGSDIADDIIDSDVEDSTTTSSAYTDAIQSDTSSSTGDADQTDNTDETDAGGDIADTINDTDGVEETETDTTQNNTSTAASEATDDTEQTSLLDYETEAGEQQESERDPDRALEDTTTTDVTQSDTSSTDETNQTDHTEETDEGGVIADDIKDKDDVDGFTPSSDSEQKRTDGDNSR